MGLTLRIEFFTTDPRRSTDFYRRVLRFAEQPGGEADGYTTVRRDQVRIGISPHPLAGDPSYRRPIDSPITTQPWGLRDFRIVDPDGYYRRITYRR